MSVSVKLKHSSTIGRTPTSGDLVNGELGLNLADEKIYMKNADGDVVQVAGPGNDYGEYVKLAGDATAQTITGAGGLDIAGNLLSSGRGEFANGLSVEGGQAVNIKKGFRGNNQNLEIVLTPTGKTSAVMYRFSPDFFNVLGSYISITGTTESASAVYGFNTNNTVAASSDVSSFQNFRSGSTFTGGGVGDPTAIDNLYHFVATPSFNSFKSTDQIAKQYGFIVQKGISPTGDDYDGLVETYAFYGNVDAEDNRENYNFVAAGSAPNFIKSDIFVGGNTARTTLALWLSTLTEEQREQHTAGTLTAPANVTTPGDGAFARQWWYDQQSEEDQALIDAGELDYPERLQVANFADVFALGDNTNIDLIASTGNIKARGLSFTKGSTNAQSVGYKGFYTSSGTKGPILLTSADVNRDNLIGLRISPYAYIYNNPGIATADTNVRLESCIALDVNSVIVNQGSNAATTVDNYIGVNFRGNGLGTITNDGSVKGFVSSQNNFAGVDGKESFNFYADGTAPNFFAGNSYIGGSADNTKINLLSNGRGEFSAGVQVTGGGVSSVVNGIRGVDNTSVRLVSESNDVFIIDQDNINDSVTNTHVALGRNPDAVLTTNTSYGLRLFGTSGTGPGTLTTYAGTQSRTQGSPSGKLMGFDISIIGNDRSSAYTTAEVNGIAVNQVTPGDNQTITKFAAFTNEAATGFLEPASTNYGFFSLIDASSSGKTNYNFYANGSAPSHFRGPVTGGGAGEAPTWSIASNGTATGITVTFAAVTTNEEAGTVETLIDIITDLRARVDALEAAAASS